MDPPAELTPPLLLPSVASQDPYAVLGVSRQATAAEIKAAYRSLVKQHHPDAGGDAATIVALNAAWELLGDRERRRHYDSRHSAPAAPSVSRGPSDQRQSRPRHGSDRDEQLNLWLEQVYAPIDRLLGQVINPFPAQLRALAADPYDDALMAAFCSFLEQSQAKLERVERLYRSQAAPQPIQALGLSLYHCLSQVQDALSELERYTMGYVDSYLRDGREMLREAKRQRSQLHHDLRQLGP